MKLPLKIFENNFEKAKQITVCGIPVTELSKDELIASLGVAMKQLETEKSFHKNTLSMFDALRGS